MIIDSAHDVLELCHVLGVKVDCVGDDLVVQGSRAHVTLELAQRIRSVKPQIVAILRSRSAGSAARDFVASPCADEATDPTHDPVGVAGEESDAWDDAIDPIDTTCSKCGSLMAWWDILGNRHCLSCEPPAIALRLLERTQSIRARLNLEQSACAAERITFYRPYVQQAHTREENR